MVKPKFFEPRPPNSNNIGRHPGIVVSNPDAENKIKVAPISHSHPGNPPTMPANTYGDFPHDPTKAGENLVDVGPPKVVSASNVKEAHGASGEPKSIEADKLALLKSHINENCAEGEKLTRRDGKCRMKTKTPSQANKKSTPKPNAAKHVTGGVALPAKKIAGVRKPAVQRTKQAPTVNRAAKPVVAAPKKGPVVQRKTGTGKK